MCLTPKHSMVKVATKDMVVRKVVFVVDGVIHSPVKKFEWELKKLVIVNTKLENKSFKVINRGLHACLTLRKAINIRGSKGKWNNRIIYKAIIPKGSIYKLGHYDDIVANQMKLIGPWKAKKK